MKHRYMVAMAAGMILNPFGQPGLQAEQAPEPRQHGYVGLRPLPFTEDGCHGVDHEGGGWKGTPTFYDQKGNYPFVAEHLDVHKAPNREEFNLDFQTNRSFFEYYWGLNRGAIDSLDPHKNELVATIRAVESNGYEVEHILIAREYDLFKHIHKDAKPGPFKEDTRILFAQDVDDIRAMFRSAHQQGIIKHDNYKLIQMVQEPSFFADDPRAHPIIGKMEGIAYEAHHFNRHWPLETGWSKPESVVRGAKWTLAQGKEFIFYYGPIIWKANPLNQHTAAGKPDYDMYYPFIERDWLHTFWKAGLPKHHPQMHYYLNPFPHAHGLGRPIGPESDPHSVLGFTKWLIQEIKGPL